MRFLEIVFSCWSEPNGRGTCRGTELTQANSTASKRETELPFLEMIPMMMKQIRLRTFFIVLFLVSAVLAFAVYQRSRNANQLSNLLDRMGPKKVEATFGNQSVPRDGWQARIFADAAQRPTELDFESITTSEAKSLARSNATDQVRIVRFVNANLPDDCPCFLAGWKLDRLIFRDCHIPESWHKQLSNAQIENLVISGAKCNLVVEELVESNSLKKITLSNQGISSARLAKLRSRNTTIKLELLGGFDTAWDFSDLAPDSTLSRHDANRFERMKLALEGLKTRIQRLEGSNVLNFTPATQEEIAKLEQTIGLPLPPSLRAFYEVTNGWPDKESVMYWGIRSTDKLAKEYENRKSLWELYFEEHMKYDFDYFAGHCYANPNALPIGFATGICVWDGKMCGVDEDGEDGPSNRKKIDLLDAMELVNQQLDRGPKDLNFSRDNKESGKISIDCGL